MKSDRPGRIQIHFRIPENDYNLIKPFIEKNGVGKFFLKVALLHCDKTILKKIEMRQELTNLYRKYNADLSHIGGNLNQRMKLCNEMAKIGNLSKDDLDDQIFIINELKNMIINLQNDLFDITKKFSKL